MTKKNKCAVKYPAAITRPLALSPAAFSRNRTDQIKSMEAATNAVASLVKQHDEKMLLLFDFYQIPRNSPDRWQALADELAAAHIPSGFTVSHSRGRPDKWTVAGADLYVAVQKAKIALATEKGVPVEAVQDVMAIRRVRKGLGNALSEKTLQNRYIRAAKQFAKPITLANLPSPGKAKP